jgi:hypothetical protein
MGNGIDSCKKRSVKPSSSLAYKLWEGFGNIGLCNSSFDIFENPDDDISDLSFPLKVNIPIRIGLGDQLETQDTLCTVH